MWWAGWRGGWLPAGMAPLSFPPCCVSHRGQPCTRKRMPPSLLREQSLVPLSPALYHSRKTFYQVSCHLPASERPVRLSNSTLPKFICRHIPLHWRSLVSSDLCAKNVADQLSLWDNFGILSGECWVSCDLTWCHRTWLHDSHWLWSNPHGSAEVRESTGTSLVLLGPAVLLTLARFYVQMHRKARATQ